MVALRNFDASVLVLLEECIGKPTGRTCTDSREGEGGSKEEDGGALARVNHRKRKGGECMIRTDVTRDVVNLLGSGAVNFVVRYIENVDDVQLYKSIKYFKKVGVERGDCDPKLVIKFTRLKDADNIWLFYNVNVVAAAMVQADRIKNCATQQ